MEVADEDYDSQRFCFYAEEKLKHTICDRNERKKYLGWTVYPIAVAAASTYLSIAGWIGEAGDKFVRKIVEDGAIKVNQTIAGVTSRSVSEGGRIARAIVGSGIFFTTATITDWLTNTAFPIEAMFQSKVVYDEVLKTSGDYATQKELDRRGRIVTLPKFAQIISQNWGFPDAVKEFKHIEELEADFSIEF